MGSHINAKGEFQSDKYPTCPAGKVPLSVKDKSAQDLLWSYAQRRRSVDAEFSDDLEAALLGSGHVPRGNQVALADHERALWMQAYCAFGLAIVRDWTSDDNDRNQEDIENWAANWADNAIINMRAR